MAENALLVMAKHPTAGEAKTRLSPPLSPHKAAGLYECFLKDTLNLIRLVTGMNRVLAYFPGDQRDYFKSLAPDFELIEQTGANLGERLYNATSYFLENQCKKVVAMDSDSPTLPAAYLIWAFRALHNDNDVVIGPCEDGGYYLIGLKQPAPRLLLEVEMSTPYVTAQTVRMAAEEGLRVHTLPAWYDIDNPETLLRLQQELSQTPDDVATHTRQFLRRLRVKRTYKD